MRRQLQFISWLALLATILPSVFYLAGWLELDRCKESMLYGTIIWFIITPFWMGREHVTKHQQVEI